MKKRFFYHEKKKRLRPFFSFLLLILGLTISFKLLNNTKIEISNKEFVKILLAKSNIIKTKSNGIDQLKKALDNLYEQPEKFLSTTTSKLIDSKTNIKPTVITNTDNNKKTKPLIYIYNTHQTEEYSPSSFLEYTVNPTVMMPNYILEETFNNQDYATIIEESSIKEILTANNWKYSSSYKASRILLEKAKEANPTLKYYIDVHRDSLRKDRTTVQINGKSYAKTIFLIGLENPNYEENLAFTTKINNLLNEKYPNLSKGIYKKEGVGVNGIYNQDFSPYAILIEIGGYENTTTEVMNSTLAFAECYMEVISTYEAKTDN